MTYFIRIQGKTFGPLGINDMQQLKQRGKLKGFHEVSQNQLDWTSASDYPELFPPVQSSISYANPEPVPVAYAAEPVPEEPEQIKPGKAPRGPRPHHRDLYFASLLMAVGLIIHFLGIQFQMYYLMESLPFGNRAREDRIILVVVTIFLLLIMFGLFLISTILCLKAGTAFQAKGLGLTSVILIVLSLIFFLSSSVTLSTGKTLDTVRIGLILGTLGSITYYASFTVLSFLYHQAFLELGRDGHAYACHLMAFAWIGVLFIFSMAAFIFSFMMGPQLEPNMILPIAITSALESLGGLQLLMFWFLFQTFALRFYLRKSLQGQG